MKPGRRRRGQTSGSLLLAALIAIASVVAAPWLLNTARAASGLGATVEPYTHLSFANAAQAIVGFPAGVPIGVEVGNETGAPAILRLVASDGVGWSAAITVRLADGASRTVAFVPPSGVRRISVGIAGRDVLIRAAVLP